ncbi:MAG: PIN domain-containing protein [Muribaculaceae bacterium]|nr:PIN domain-containing protein [Roseburia sp.]MCM1430792.1 PIN domain-containing protein [Muribaculaceae bacterium]MCM1492771.1 PIN domain-containing protein [Muribaculaceae bacterium]
MNVFLVDFENVNSSGLNGISALDANDQIVIFYSENADSMTFDLHEQINSSKAQISFQRVDVGRKNALDFQLATYLGYLVCENEKENRQVRYYVVTKDRGYSSLVTFWTKRGIEIVLAGSLASSKIVEDSETEPEKPGKSAGDKKAKPEKSDKSAGDKKAKPEKSEKSAGDKKAKPEKSEKSGKKGNKKKDETPEQRQLRIQVEEAVPDKDVVDLVVSYIQKYKTKTGISNALAKEFRDSRKASEIYKSIKPLIADKKGQ